MLPYTLLVLGAASTVSAGTLSVPLERRAPVVQNVHDLARALSRRASGNGTTQLTALNNITAAGYYADFSIGTPGQKITFQLDTGSSDTWMNSVDTTYCSSTIQQSQSGYCTATFDASQSKSYKLVSRGGFDITYLDQRHIRGNYFNDTVTIEGHEITNQQLGLATTSVRPTGIMGLGLSINVAATKKYSTIIENMVEEGVIAHPAFSLYLNDLDAKSGTILFGGIDSAKYLSNLVTLPLKPLPSTQATTNVTSYAVTIQGISVKGVNIPATTAGSVAIMDSGSTISLVPDTIVAPIHKQFGVVVLQYQGQSIPPLVDCAWRGSKGNGIVINFNFEGKTIKVPIEEMALDTLPEEVQQIIQSGSAPSDFKGWSRACLFGLGASSQYGVKSDKFYLLGDTFLRSAYVAYDMANQQIGLAQANVNSTSSNIIEIEKNAKGFPAVNGSSDSGPQEKDSATGRVTPSLVAASVLMGMAAVFSSL